MKPDLRTYRLRFPRDLTAESVIDLLLNMAGQSTTHAIPVRLSARGSAGAVEHFLAVPVGQARIIRRLTRQLPGLELEDLDRPLPQLQYVWRLWQSSSRRPFRVDREELTSRALLISLLGARSHEALELRWLLGPIRRPLSVGSKHPPISSEGWPRALLTAAFLPPGDVDADARRALRDKLKEPAWRAMGQLAVKAADRRRAQQLASDLMAALRTSEAPGVKLGVRRSSAKQLERLPWRWPLQLNAVELTGLLGWPIGDSAAGLPVAKRTHRQLEPVGRQPAGGRHLGDTPAGRPIWLDPRDSLQHLHVLGPTGTGKSTLLQRLILQDIAAGSSVVVLDPKGDLVDDVLRRYPLKRLADLVVLDPRDDAPVGLNPLAAPRQPELVADQLLSIFSNLFRDSFGPRTADVLHASLLTLARWGQGSLAVLPLLLTNRQLRRQIVGQTVDPLGTGPFWAWYERLSDAERQQVIAPTLNKVRPFVLRPALRAVIGQVAPRFEVGDVTTKRLVLLVNLAKGQLGPEGSALLGTVLLNQLWQAVLGRAAIPAKGRRPVNIYVDEVQDYLRLPGDVGDVLAQARGMGAGFTLAHQHLGQLPPDLRSAVLANARSRVLFQLAADDARVMSHGHPELSAEDMTSLPPFEAYASLLQNSEVRPYVSLRTLPPAPETTSVGALRLTSQQRFGVSRQATEQALQGLLSGPGRDGDDVIGRRPRRKP